jgi:hypothetical protein
MQWHHDQTNIIPLYDYTSEFWPTHMSGQTILHHIPDDTKMWVKPDIIPLIFGWLIVDGAIATYYWVHKLPFQVANISGLVTHHLLSLGIF